MPVAGGLSTPVVVLVAVVGMSGLALGQAVLITLASPGRLTVLAWTLL